MFTAALTLLRNKGSILPFRKKTRVHIVAATDEPDLQVGETLQEVLGSHVQSVTLSHLWNESRSEAVDRIAAQLRGADAVVLSVYLSVGSWKGHIGFSNGLQEFLKKIGRMKKPVVTIAFGDPYVLGKLPTTDAAVAAYTGLRKAEEMVGKALSGLAEMRGKLPVTIPGKFKRGDGIHFSPARRSRN